MLLPENVHPEDSIYYNGALVLRVLHSRISGSIVDLFQEVREIRAMSFPVFVLCLDWLYLIDAAVLSDDGVIELCS